MTIAKRVFVSFAVASLTLVPGYANSLLTNWGPTGLSYVSDGTSNTIGFTETTQLSFCVSNVGIQGAQIANPIHDGTSNTLLFGESGFAVNVGFIAPHQSINNIVDGTSNTIFLGEVPVDSFCLGDVTPSNASPVDGTSNTIVFGEGSQFDVCADNVRIGHIADGTSNTIVFGEVVPRACLTDVGVNPASAGAVPEPGTLLLFAVAMSPLVLTRRRKVT